MRVKLVAVATVLVAALGVTGGAVWMSKADAQPPVPGTGGSSLGPPPGPGGNTGFGPPPAGGSSFGPPPSPGSSSFAPPGMGSAPPRTGSSGTGMTMAPPAWEYKLVDVKNDRTLFEAMLAQHGKDGWEFCSSERFDAGPTGKPGQLTLVFKKRKGETTGTGMGTPMGPTPGSGSGTPPVLKTYKLKHINAAETAASLNKILTGREVRVTFDAATNSIFISGDAAAVKQLQDVIDKIITDGDVKPAPGGAADPKAPTGGSGMPTAPGTGSSPGGPMGGPPSAVHMSLTVYTLKNAKAAELAKVVEKVFAPQGVEVTADPRTNRLIIRSDDDTIPALKRIIEELDVSVPK